MSWGFGGATFRAGWQVSGGTGSDGSVCLSGTHTFRGAMQTHHSLVLRIKRWQRNSNSSMCAKGSIGLSLAVCSPSCSSRCVCVTAGPGVLVYVCRMERQPGFAEGARSCAVTLATRGQSVVFPAGLFVCAPAEGAFPGV